MEQPEKSSPSHCDRVVAVIQKLQHLQQAHSIDSEEKEKLKEILQNLSAFQSLADKEVAHGS